MDTAEINELVWWAREKIRGFMTGLHRSPDFGYSVEFAQHRGYVPGDSPKHIDWAMLAKTDKYLTKQYEAESNLRTYFLVDSSSSMHFPEGEESKWNAMLKLLTLISTLLLKQRDAMGIMEVSYAGRNFFEAKSTDQWVEQLLSHLGNNPDQHLQNDGLSNALTDLEELIPKRSQVLVFHDPFLEDTDELLNSIGQLAHNNHHVRVFTLYSEKHELNPSSMVGSLVFDPETGERSQLTDSLAKEFETYVRNQLKLIERGCRDMGVQQISLNTDESAMVNLLRMVEE